MSDGNAQPRVPLNDQGKLLIPKDLCESAGLAADSTVVLAGRYFPFEIWNAETYETAGGIEYRENLADDLGVI